MNIVNTAKHLNFIDSISKEEKDEFLSTVRGVMLVNGITPKYLYREDSNRRNNYMFEYYIDHIRSYLIYKGNNRTIKSLANRLIDNMEYMLTLFCNLSIKDDYKLIDLAKPLLTEKQIDIWLTIAELMISFEILGYQEYYVIHEKLTGGF